MTREAATANNLLDYHDSTESNAFALDGKFKPNRLVIGVEARKGATAGRLVVTATLGSTLRLCATEHRGCGVRAQR